LVTLLTSAAVSLSGCGGTQAAELLVTGDSKDIHERPEDAPPNSPKRPALLVLALDGVGRDLLYDMLKQGELPEMARLLGGTGSAFGHAHFDERYLSTLPSSTAVAWVTAFTGVPPAEHGLAGNEYFIREKRQFAAPVPVTFHSPEPVLATYTDQYVNELTLAPSVYEQMRERDPHVSIWVAMHQLHRGADRLLVTDRAVLADAFKAFLEEQITEKLARKDSKAVYSALDKQVIETVVEELSDDDDPVPDVLTIYLSGTDQFAHVADIGPDKARRKYLKDEVDPLMKDLREALQERNALHNRYVVITADHGHTEVMDDDEHALAMDEEDDPPGVLLKAGFRLRPFQLDVSEDHDFNAVLAYQGAMAYVYVADRSTCEKEGKACDFSRPPRFKEDVLVAAQAFYDANQRGKYVKGMKGTLDMVLTRKPKASSEKDEPFQVYVGGGKLVPVERYLAGKPHPTYVDLDERLRDLAVGKYGERAGDVLLIANNGNRETPKERYYFSSRYRSWHGSPSRQDSEIPLIVAHPGRTAQQLAAQVKQVLGDEPSQQKLSSVLLSLRFGERAARKRLNAQARRE
jgi:predicted AlkP superfamily pyrophosphatase or phosphodiesterase